MRVPDPNRYFILETDGSCIALAAILKQRFEDIGLEHPVGFYSWALSGFERNYAAYEFKLYAVVRAVEHFRIFFLGKEFLLRTDPAVLQNILRRDLPPQLVLSAGSFASTNTPSKSSTREARITLLPTFDRLFFASAQSNKQSSPSSNLLASSSFLRSNSLGANSTDQHSEVTLVVSSNGSNKESDQLTI